MDKEKIVCKTHNEFDRHVLEFIKTLKPKVSVGMYNVGEYIEKIKEYKKRLEKIGRAHV